MKMKSVEIRLSFFFLFSFRCEPIFVILHTISIISCPDSKLIEHFLLTFWFMEYGLRLRFSQTLFQIKLFFCKRQAGDVETEKCCAVFSSFYIVSWAS